MDTFLLFPFFNMFGFLFCFDLGVFDRDVFALVGFEDGSNVWRAVDRDG